MLFTVNSVFITVANLLSLRVYRIGQYSREIMKCGRLLFDLLVNVNVRLIGKACTQHSSIDQGWKTWLFGGKVLGV